MGPEFLTQAVDMNVEGSVLGIELALEHFEDQLLASDDGAGRFSQSRKDLVFDRRQR